MNCYDCLSEDRSTPAAAVCRRCGAGVCTSHTHTAPQTLRRSSGLGRTHLPRPARRMTCTTCYKAEVQP
ncbi:DUF2180 family protein [Streptomyces nanshensis]|uniref:DUF2180 domain-containing protein n=1 Tax=Streptomyces nanshensis TaxID=518642 RepID=A0A1E7KVL5_9ACTN|nr:DUF2180 family protein [Streptomyces nanshensis]OEV07965.1 hypothetical protein AN218_28170 [Streptomyces nanshensis]